MSANDTKTPKPRILVEQGNMLLLFLLIFGGRGQGQRISGIHFGNDVNVILRNKPFYKE